MSTIIIPNSFSGGDTIDASDMNENFDAIKNGVNGNLTAANFKDASITVAKMSVSLGLDDVNRQEGSFFATLSSDQNISTGNSYEKVEFGTVSFDTSSAYDNVTNYRFTAPTTGHYIVSASLSFGDTDTIKLYRCRIYKNGSGTDLYSAEMAYDSSSPELSVLASGLLSLNSGDYIEVYAANESSSDAAILNQYVLNSFLPSRPATCFFAFLVGV